jgi:outer membrane protein assembly factor BamB
MAVSSTWPSKAGYGVALQYLAFQSWLWCSYSTHRMEAAGGDLPPGKEVVQGNITALNRTNGNIIWNFRAVHSIHSLRYCI